MPNNEEIKGNCTCLPARDLAGIDVPSSWISPSFSPRGRQTRYCREQLALHGTPPRHLAEQLLRDALPPVLVVGAAKFSDNRVGRRRAGFGCRNGTRTCASPAPTSLSRRWTWAWSIGGEHQPRPGADGGRNPLLRQLGHAPHRFNDPVIIPGSRATHLSYAVRRDQGSATGPWVKVVPVAAAGSSCSLSWFCSASPAVAFGRN